MDKPKQSEPSTIILFRHPAMSKLFVAGLLVFFALACIAEASKPQLKIGVTVRGPAVAKKSYEFTSSLLLTLNAFETAFNDMI